MCASLTTSQRRIFCYMRKCFLTFSAHFLNINFFSPRNILIFLLLFFFAGFLKLIFFISIIFVILLIIIASIIYIWVIRKFSTNLEQVNRRRLPEEVNHNLLNHSIQDFEALVSRLNCSSR